MGYQVFVPYRGEEHATNHLRVSHTNKINANRLPALIALYQVMGDVGQVVSIKYNLLDKESIRRAMKNRYIYPNNFFVIFQNILLLKMNLIIGTFYVILKWSNYHFLHQQRSYQSRQSMVAQQKFHSSLRQRRWCSQRC